MKGKLFLILIKLLELVKNENANTKEAGQREISNCEFFHVLIQLRIPFESHFIIINQSLKMN